MVDNTQRLNFTGGFFPLGQVPGDWCGLAGAYLELELNVRDSDGFPDPCLAIYPCNELPDNGDARSVATRRRVVYLLRDDGRNLKLMRNSLVHFPALWPVVQATDNFTTKLAGQVWTIHLARKDTAPLCEVHTDVYFTDPLPCMLTLMRATSIAPLVSIWQAWATMGGDVVEMPSYTVGLYSDSGPGWQATGQMDTLEVYSISPIEACRDATIYWGASRVDSGAATVKAVAKSELVGATIDDEDWLWNRAIPYSYRQFLSIEEQEEWLNVTAGAAMRMGMVTEVAMLLRHYLPLPERRMVLQLAAASTPQHRTNRLRLTMPFRRKESSNHG